MKDIRKKLRTVTKKSEKDCNIINDILNEHFIIGKNNKIKICNDFMVRLGISNDQADELYNQCISIIVKGIFKRK